MKNLIIIGAGGFGREVLAWSRQAIDPLPVKGFLDDNLQALDRFTKDVEVIGRVEDYQPEIGDVFVCAIGRIDLKKRCIERILSRGGVFTHVIHRTVVLGENVSLGEGVILCPYSIVCSDVRLDDFVSVNLHSTVDHDAVVGRWSQLHCHVDVTGGVVLGQRVLVGSHASILPGTKVGDDAVVGAGTIVSRDVPASSTFFGVPGRVVVTQREVAHA